MNFNLKRREVKGNLPGVLSFCCCLGSLILRSKGNNLTGVGITTFVCIGQSFSHSSSKLSSFSSCSEHKSEYGSLSVGLKSSSFGGGMGNDILGFSQMGEKVSTVGVLSSRVNDWMLFTAKYFCRVKNKYSGGQK